MWLWRPARSPKLLPKTKLWRGPTGGLLLYPTRAVAAHPNASSRQPLLWRTLELADTARLEFAQWDDRRFREFLRAPGFYRVGIARYRSLRQRRRYGAVQTRPSNMPNLCQRRPRGS